MGTECKKRKTTLGNVFQTESARRSGCAFTQAEEKLVTDSGQPSDGLAWLGHCLNTGGMRREVKLGSR